MDDFKCCCGERGLCAKGCGRQDKQLNSYDWLADLPGNEESTDLVEVQFKNTRKGYYHNSNALPLDKGDVVAVEASPGHDIGVVSLTGQLALLQMKRANLKSEADIKRIYRKVKQVDMDKYEEAKGREHDTMIRSRQIAKDLGLQMKIGDVEYQGDGNKAIFYYIADGRVDFRQLIKVLADAFHVRIEMKQIGARQEAGRIGGIGPCGRELCCATWMKNFVSVSTNAARLQDISLNPQKLAGQCAKLKCCLNYEADLYVEANKHLPSRETTLETADGTFYFFKADILSGQITYSTDKHLAANLVTISSRRAFEVVAMNRKGEKPTALDEKTEEPPRSADLVEQDSLTRFDKRKKKRPRPDGRRDGQRDGQPGNGQPRNAQPRAQQPNGNSPENGPQGAPTSNADRNNGGRDNRRDGRPYNNNQRDRRPRPDHQHGRRPDRPGRPEGAPTNNNNNGAPRPEAAPNRPSVDANKPQKPAETPTPQTHNPA
jgi:cell fate regulator YaaT (PSP1 superfamily)